MGTRGPKPRFLDVACPNEKCTLFGVAGKGNVTVYGTYERSSGKGRKFVCHTCETTFCDRTNTLFYDLRTDEEKVKMALKMAMRGMSVLGIAETVEVKPSTASTWISKAGMHCEKVNKVVLNDVETPKVEMDELWTFVEKKRCPGKMNSKTTGLGSG
jgi:transposase-like protein